MTLRHRVLPHHRRKELKEKITAGQAVRIIEAHDGLSSLIGSTTSIKDQDGQSLEFDGLWVSSLTDSAAKGHPDTEVIDTSSRLLTIQEILQVTNKPIIVDGDTGGAPTQFEYFCSKLENLGVSIVVIEDKKHPKRNSLDPSVKHVLEDPHDFATKINRAKAVCLSEDFMIFARIESFIAGQGLADAIKRADIYLDSQVDGIMIHSKAETPDEIYAFMEAYEKLCKKKGFRKPVLAVPTTYNTVTDEELFNKGISIVIYANHLLRAAHKAMDKVCRTILKNKRSHETVKDIATVKEVMETVGFQDVKAKDEKYKENPTPVIILASGKTNGFAGTEFQNMPVSNLPIANKPLLEWQLTMLNQVGLTNVTLISGQGKEQLNTFNAEEIYNPDYANTNSLYSLMLAREKLTDGFIVIFGDIFFDKYILQRQLMNVESDILLVADNTVNLRTRKIIKPTADLVILKHSNNITSRKPNVITELVAEIGTKVSPENATHEFIGIAKFSKEGAKVFCDAYDQLKSNKEPLGFNPLLRALIAKGIPVEALVVNRGWSEVQNMTDIAAIEKTLNRAEQENAATIPI